MLSSWAPRRSRWVRPWEALPVLKPREVCQALELLGFALVRQRGLHMQYRHADGRGNTVPNHDDSGLASRRECTMSPTSVSEKVGRSSE
jgi:predicted RNA binding protein YcfA (HicA-like mRNA interferase family)